MPLISVPRKPKERYLELCLAVKNATTYAEYKHAETKAKVCSDLIQDFWPDAWFLIISEADAQAEENACCGIVYRTEDDFKPKEHLHKWVPTGEGIEHTCDCGETVPF